MKNSACIFAGQGAQTPGMGADFAQDQEIADLFAQANDVLKFDLTNICFEGPAEELTKSNICQPAIFAVSVAAFKAFQKQCPQQRFSMAAGLSLGEWTALHVAGVLSFEATLEVLEARGRFMQEACAAQPSGMVSIMGATDTQLDELCSQAGISKANINSDAQVVLSGAKEGIAKAAALAAEMGIKAIVLNVAGAFHSPLMASAREQLAAIIDQVPFTAPQMPVLANVTGQPHSSDPQVIKETMLRQVTEPVQWHDCVKYALANDVNTFVEFGPGKVLSGLIRRIERGATTLNVADAASLAATAKVIQA